MTPDLLEQRLIDFGANACLELRRLPKDIVGTHLAKQLVRSATSPAANYAEARAAESGRDFVHKLQICLKELRETSVWIRLVYRLGRPAGRTGHLDRECRELIALFATSVNTARRGQRNRPGPVH
jgi:four helix bundle protein